MDTELLFNLGGGKRVELCCEDDFCGLWVMGYHSRLLHLFLLFLGVCSLPAAVLSNLYVSLIIGGLELGMRLELWIGWVLMHVFLHCSVLLSVLVWDVT